MSDDKTPVD